MTRHALRGLTALAMIGLALTGCRSPLNLVKPHPGPGPCQHYPLDKAESRAVFSHNTKLLEERIALSVVNASFSEPEPSKLGFLLGSAVVTAIGKAVALAVARFVSTIADEFHAVSTVSREIRLSGVQPAGCPPGMQGRPTLEYGALWVIVRAVDIRSRPDAPVARPGLECLCRVNDRKQIRLIVETGLTKAREQLCIDPSSLDKDALIDSLCAQLHPTSECEGEDLRVTFIAIGAISRDLSSTCSPVATPDLRVRLLAYHYAALKPLLSPTRWGLGPRASLTVELRGPSGDSTYAGDAYRESAVFDVQPGIPSPPDIQQWPACSSADAWVGVENWDYVPEEDPASQRMQAEAGIPRFAVPNRKALRLSVAFIETSRVYDLLKRLAKTLKDTDFEWVIPDSWKKKDEDEEDG